MKAQVEAAGTIRWGPADAVKKNADLKSNSVELGRRYTYFKDTSEIVQEGGGSLLGTKMSFRLNAFELP